MHISLELWLRTLVPWPGDLQGPGAGGAQADQGPGGREGADRPQAGAASRARQGHLCHPEFQTESGHNLCINIYIYIYASDIIYIHMHMM